jgi:hypothetical protein
MDDKKKYLEDIKEIKEMMSRSSRVISLSGISGIMAGVIALGSAYLAYITVYSGQNYLGYRRAATTNESLLILLGIAFVTIVLTVSISLFFTIKKAKKSNSRMWDSQTKRLLINLSIPLSTGGILCLILLLKGYIGIIAPLTLIFYGLALVNASKYMLSDIKGLGLFEIVLGLLAVQFIGYGLLFWAIGFGVLHIIYGIIMHVKYDS